jgi:serine/threonine protein kinase
MMSMATDGSRVGRDPGFQDLRLVDVLASSRGSIVYEALRTRDGRRFAVKLLTDDSLELSLRFEMEAAALARIRHPHVVEVFASTKTRSGRPCIVMPLLVGQTLAGWFATSGRLSEARAAKLVVSVLSGLGAAHAAGVVHRDVCPRNVFVGRASDEPAACSRPVLIDFGLAKLHASDVASDLSRRHPALGDPAYMAPEQILGRAVDARTDVYAAGVLLFEALAGRPPFVHGDPRGVLDAQLDRRAPELARVTYVSARVSRIVARALEKRPEDRFASAEALAGALAAACMGPRDCGIHA